MVTVRPKLVALAWLLALFLCLAWGYGAHRIVGEIASQYITPEARAGVEELLGNQSLADVSNWADEIRSDREWDWAKPASTATLPS